MVASIALGECESSGLGVLDRWRSVFGAAVASASHGSSGPAPGQIDGPIVVPLVSSEGTGTIELGMATVGVWSFCRLHVSAGQSAADADVGVTSPSGTDLSGMTLQLAGTMVDDPSIEWSWSSSSAGGAFVELDPTITVTDATTIEIAFDLDRAIDGAGADGLVDLAGLLASTAVDTSR